MSSTHSDSTSKHDNCCAHASTPVVASSSSSSSSVLPSVPAATAAVSCSNCDDPLNPLFAFACADCDEDLTPTCASCCQSLHRPVRTRRHRLTRLSDRIIQQNNQNQNQNQQSTVQRGFCANCKQMGKNALQIPLADLECESCSLGDPAATPSGLCLDCDVSIHQSLDNDDHVRLVFDDDDADATSPTSLQSELFALAGVEGLRICHQDSMPSYAGRIWPGSMMLARYLEQLNRDTPNCFRDTNIIELGCGCAAIPALTCWLLGASQLWCTDMNTDGLNMLDQNVKLILQQLQQRNLPLPAVNDCELSEKELEDLPQLEPVSSCTHGCENHKSHAAPVLLTKRKGMHTQMLAFGDDVKPFSQLLPFDYILGSYILYDPDSFEPLSRTLDALVPREAKSQILLTSHEPTREGIFLSLLEEKGFTWKRIPFSLQSAHLSDETHVDVAHSNIGTGLRSTSIIVVSRKPLLSNASAAEQTSSTSAASCTHVEPNV